MDYKFNPNFSKHINANKSNYKFIVRKDENNSYSNPNVNDMKHEYKTKLINFVESDMDSENELKIYKLDDIDHPNGWSFKEIDMLGDMGFRIDDEYKMMSEIEIPSLKMQNEKINTFIYKTDEGYTLETNRKYVFETFDKMLEFIDSIPLTDL